MECVQCANTKWDIKQRSAMISFESFGDEYIESYFLCHECDAYSVEVFHDSFHGPDTILTRGPIPRAEGDRIIAIIEQCPQPGDKKCRCEAHKLLEGRSFPRWLEVHIDLLGV